MASREVVGSTIPHFYRTIMMRQRLELDANKFFWHTRWIDARLSRKWVIQDGIPDGDLTTKTLLRELMVTFSTQLQSRLQCMICALFGGCSRPNWPQPILNKLSRSSWRVGWKMWRCTLTSSCISSSWISSSVGSSSMLPPSTWGITNQQLFKFRPSLSTTG